LRDFLQASSGASGRVPRKRPTNPSLRGGS
jgi:hypothetical protein